MPIGQSEFATQQDVLEFFQNKLDYKYIGNLKDITNTNIKEERLRTYLINKGYSESVINKAILRFINIKAIGPEGAAATDQKVYEVLKYGMPIQQGLGKEPVTVYFIDWEHPTNNDFAIAEEVTVVEKQNKRPDIVIYVNGIALAVIELKKSAVSVSQGIHQNITNQKQEFIPQFFTTMQFCMAANKSEGLRYGTHLTSAKHYTEWKPDRFKEKSEERDSNDIIISQRLEEIKLIPKFAYNMYAQIYMMFDKTRFLDLIRNFIIFDNGVKKVCRYNQYYAVKRAQNRIKQHKGGIIWHTQGSGKTLSMVWLAKWIKENIQEGRVLLITDREELDDQIESTFVGVGENKIIRTTSGEHLIKILNKDDTGRSQDAGNKDLICSLIHKFGHHNGHDEDVSAKDYDKFIEEVKASLPIGFKAKGNIVVFVDECHRTQSGKLHQAMEAILPDAVFIGFTGTPLLKADKATTLEIFGPYIHTYKFNEAVEDKVVLDLRYDPRDIDQWISSPDKVDAKFERLSRGLSARAKNRLKEKWARLQKTYSSKSRLERIAIDIEDDFELKNRLAEGRGNAILVANNIYSACKIYDIFQQRGFTKCAIISSYVPSISDLRTDSVDVDKATEMEFKFKTYIKMIGLDMDHLDSVSIPGRLADFEKDAKNKFKNHPSEMKLLIVVDKLLTGFDATPCSYIYIDKHMENHGLFQAICRVNRLDTEDKDFGYIVDYAKLFGNLEEAVKSYTSGAFEGYDEADIKGVIKSRKDESLKYFLKVFDALESLCEGVEEPKGELQYEHYFCGDRNEELTQEEEEAYARLRDKLYSYVNSLARAYEEAAPNLQEAYGYEKYQWYDQKVRDYAELKQIIANYSGDYVDLKAYEIDMRKLIDDHVIAGESKRITELDDLTLINFVAKEGEKLTDDNTSPETKQSAAEAIENNIKRELVERRLLNPKYYSDLSLLLKEIMDQRRQEVLDYKEFLKKCAELAKKVENPEEDNQYPEEFRDHPMRRAIYDFVSGDVELARQLCDAYFKNKMEGFTSNKIKANKLKRSFYNVLGDDDKVERLYKIAEDIEVYGKK